MSEYKSFVAIAPCGGVIACAVDAPDRRGDNAKFVAKLIRDGLTVEKWATEDVRAAKWCSCKTRDAQKKIIHEVAI